MAIKNTRKIKGFGDTEVYSMVAYVGIDKEAETVLIVLSHYKDEATRQADVTDYISKEPIKSDDFSDFKGLVDTTAKAYEKAKAKDEALASGVDV